MGLAASQARYLALTARKSDLEFQSQTINTRRIQLAYKTAEVARAYSEGMSNKRIKMATSQDEKGNNIYKELTFGNLNAGGYMVIGINGTGLSPSPYMLDSSEKSDSYVPSGDGHTIEPKEYNGLGTDDKAAYKANQAEGYSLDQYAKAAESARACCTPVLASISQEDYDALPDAQKEENGGGEIAVKFGNPGTETKCKFTWVNDGSNWVKKITFPEGKTSTDLTPDDTKGAVGIDSEGRVIESYTHAVNYKLQKISSDVYSKLSDSVKALYKSSPELKTTYIVNPDYELEGGFNIQSLLTSGKAQVVTKAFFDFLVSRFGYNFAEGMTLEQYKKAMDEWNEPAWNPDKAKSIVDWSSDETNMFREENYTEDDAAVLAKYTADTAEIQAQDKRLEIEEKNIETQHKAIETELESIQKVIQTNIDKTFKIFS